LIPRREFGSENLMSYSLAMTVAPTAPDTSESWNVELASPSTSLHQSGKNETNAIESLISADGTPALHDGNVERKEEPKNNESGGTGAFRQRHKKEYAVSVRWEREYEERGAALANGTCCPSGCTGTVEDFNSYCCCWARRRIGGMFFLLERANGSPLIVAGPCWPFCTFFTTPLILVVSGLVSYFVVLNQDLGVPWWLKFIYFPILVITLISLFCVSCRDPGMIERVTDEEAGRDGWFWNEQTGSFRPVGAMYCRECKVLIQDYDHLCPWTGTGIGQRNMVAFKVFVASVNIICYFSIALVAFVLISGMGVNSK